MIEFFCEFEGEKLNIVFFRGLILTRNQYGTGITGGSPTLNRRDSTSPRPLRRPLHPGGGSM